MDGVQSETVKRASTASVAYASLLRSQMAQIV